jgi:hypothetical protein
LAGFFIPLKKSMRTDVSTRIIAVL